MQILLIYLMMDVANMLKRRAARRAKLKKNN